MRVSNDSRNGKEGEVTGDICGGHCGESMN